MPVDPEDFSICHFTEHREFIQLCRNAEAQAQQKGQKIHFWWRGYRGVVAANLPRMTVPGLEVRLMNALSKVSNKTISETMVKKIVISLLRLTKHIFFKFVRRWFQNSLYHYYD